MVIKHSITIEKWCKRVGSRKEEKQLYLSNLRNAISTEVTLSI
ncbi:MAG: hypothetical protein SWX82_03080 [Cyanobacteriota bacterium]|nr:hypothetical protein [Cyanobacteriota bacterium]